MTILENITVFKCDHCNRKMFVKHAMEKHEPNCGANPENWRVCSNCDFMVRKPIRYYFDTYEGEHSDTSNAFYCNKLEIYIYPPYIENKPFFTNNPDQFEDQIPFKKECEELTVNTIHHGKNYDLNGGI